MTVPTKSRSLDEEIMSARVAPRQCWGQVRYCDRSRVVYDPENHRWEEVADDNPDGRPKVVIGIETFKNDNSTYVPEQTYYITGSKGDKWIEITAPSLQKLHVSVADLAGRWCHYELAPYTYRKDGENRSGETFRFLEFFDDENACVRDRMNSVPPSRRVQTEADAVDDADDGVALKAAPAKAAVPGLNANQKAAKMLWTGVGHDDDKFIAQIKRNRPVLGEFNGDAMAALRFVKGEQAVEERTEDVPTADVIEGVEDLPF